jgi:hypothetical protein
MSTPINMLPGDDPYSDDIPLTEEELFDGGDASVSTGPSQLPPLPTSTLASGASAASNSHSGSLKIMKSQIITKEFVILVVLFWLMSQRYIEYYISKIPHIGNFLVSNSVIVKCLLLSLVFVLVEYFVFNKVIFS